MFRFRAEDILNSNLLNDNNDDSFSSDELSDHTEYNSEEEDEIAIGDESDAALNNITENQDQRAENVYTEMTNVYYNEFDSASPSSPISNLSNIIRSNSFRLDNTNNNLNNNIVLDSTNNNLHNNNVLINNNNNLNNNQLSLKEYKSKNLSVWYNRQQTLINSIHNNKNPCLNNNVFNFNTINEFFNYLIDDNIINKIIEYTNKRMNDNEKISYKEFKAFIGLLLIFGVTGKNNIDINDIWMIGSPHHFDWASAAMPRDRFKLISSKVCFDDPSTRVERSRVNKKFHKMSEIFRLFKINIGSAYHPGDNLTIDEQLYAYRGRCSFKQFMPSKPAKYGLKYWSLVDNDTAYLLDADIYLGKDLERATNVGENVVKKLSVPFLNSNRSITVDNFFTSVPLADFLWQNSTTLIGTLRKNKPHIPSEFFPHNKKDINSSLFGFNNYKTLVSYVPKKNKAVILLSTHHHEEKTITELNNKPEIINFYNKTKGGVDTLDKLTEQFTCRRKTNRWTYNVFMYILDVAAYNSFVLFKIKNPAIQQINVQRQRKDSLEKLSTNLILDYVKERIEKLSLNNFIGVQNSLFESFKRIGVTIPASKKRPRVEDESNLLIKKLKRCDYCLRRDNDNKYKDTCHECNRTVCKLHGEKIITVMCTECANK